MVNSSSQSHLPHSAVRSLGASGAYESLYLARYIVDEMKGKRKVGVASTERGALFAEFG
jgi:hypothetical protein